MLRESGEHFLSLGNFLPLVKETLGLLEFCCISQDGTSSGRQDREADREHREPIVTGRKRLVKIGAASVNAGNPSRSQGTVCEDREGLVKSGDYSHERGTLGVNAFCCTSQKWDITGELGEISLKTREAVVVTREPLDLKRASIRRSRTRLVDSRNSAGTRGNLKDGTGRQVTFVGYQYQTFVGIVPLSGTGSQLRHCCTSSSTPKSSSSPASPDPDELDLNLDAGGWKVTFSSRDKVQPRCLERETDSFVARRIIMKTIP